MADVDKLCNLVQLERGPLFNYIYIHFLFLMVFFTGSLLFNSFSQVGSLVGWGLALRTPLTLFHLLSGFSLNIVSPWSLQSSLLNFLILFFFPYSVHAIFLLTPQFKSPSALHSMLLLGWSIKPYLKHPTNFLVQNLKVFHIPPKSSIISPYKSIPQPLVPISILVLFHCYEMIP